MAKPKIRFKGYQDDWEQRKLGDYCDMYNGDRSSKYPNAQDMVVEGIPFINAGDLENGHVNLTTCNKISREKYDDLGGAKLQLGDIVYCLRGTLGKNAYIDNFPEGTVASSLVAIRPKNIDGRYLFHVLNSDIEYRQRVVHDEGAAQPNLSAKSVSGFMIPIPHIDEQKKVSEYFDNLDHLITLHQRKCDEAKKIKKIMLQKMFPQNGSRVPEIRFDGFTDDWEQRKLGDIIIEYKETVDSDCTLPILTSSKTEGVILQEEHFGRKQQHDITGYNILPRNYCTYRNRSDGVDFTFNINKCCDKGIISKFYPVFSGKNSDVFFLSLVLNNSDEVVREIAYTCTGTGQKVLSFLDLQKMKVRAPRFNEQKEIAAYFESLDHLITLHQQKCTDLKNLKKYMLQNMFI